MACPAHAEFLGEQLSLFKNPIGFEQIPIETYAMLRILRDFERTIGFFGQVRYPGQ
jgi:hypothetical protein